MAHSIIEQVLSIKVGSAIEGRTLELRGGETTSDAILSLFADEIRSAGMAARKSQTPLELAVKFPEPRLQELAGLPVEDVRAALASVRCIGKWTADTFLIFYLGRPGVFRLGGWNRPPCVPGALRCSMTDANVRKAVCSLWRPYTSAAMRYMYRTLTNGIVEWEQSDALLI